MELISGATNLQLERTRTVEDMFPDLYGWANAQNLAIEGLPNLAEVLMYTRPVIDSIGNNYSMVIISGSDQSDWILTLANHQDIKDILGINNDFYDVSGVPIEMSWTELQTAADGNVYLFAGLLGAVLYSVDMSADEARIMSVLGGLYVLLPAVNALNPDGSNALNPDGSNAVLP